MRPRTPITHHKTRFMYAPGFRIWCPIWELIYMTKPLDRLKRTSHEKSKSRDIPPT